MTRGPGEPDVLVELLGAPPVTVGDSLEGFAVAVRPTLARFEREIDRALLGGFAADRLGFAFAVGYDAALRALVPSLEGDGWRSLCATEAAGAHPRAIATRLTPGPGGSFVLDGEKRWATMSPQASLLLVVASTGADDAGRNRLRVVRVARAAAGVTVRPMPAPPFAPEIPHAEVQLAGVVVAADDVLPGDGYDDYLKPFRTVEDVHVHASLLGFLIGIARRSAWPPVLVERMVAAALVARAVAEREPSSPATHVALAGLIAATAAILVASEPYWALVDGETRTRWERDRPLLEVAGRAREARRASAWRGFGRELS